jgi:hypothetical protein
MDLLINEPEGVPYITYKDGSVSCNKSAADDIPPLAEEVPQSEV